MSDELQKNYEIFKTKDSDYPVVVLKRFCHSISQQQEAIVEELKASHYQGWVLFDQLFTGGNIDLRYGKQYFDGEFTGKLFRVELSMDHPLRQMVSKYLSEHHLYEGTNLTDEDIQSLQEGRVI